MLGVEQVKIAAGKLAASPAFMQLSPTAADSHQAQSPSAVHLSSEGIVSHAVALKPIFFEYCQAEDSWAATTTREINKRNLHILSKTF